MRDYDLNDPDDRKYLAEQYSASLVFIAASSGQRDMKVQINGVRKDNVMYGDWLVTVERVPHKRHLN